MTSITERSPHHDEKTIRFAYWTGIVTAGIIFGSLVISVILMYYSA